MKIEKYKEIYPEILEKLKLFEADRAGKVNNPKEAEEILRYEYEKKELQEQKELLEKYFKRAEYKEKVEKEYENFFRNSEE